MQYSAPDHAPIACPSCGTAIARRFCPACGEQRRSPGDLGLAKIVRDALESVFTVDSKLLRSALALLRPGFLTAEYVRGARVRYARPTAVFVFANVAYFLLQPLTNANTFRTTLDTHLHRSAHSTLASRWVDTALARTGQTLADYSPEFDARADNLSRLLLFAFLPVLVTIFALLRPRDRQPLGVHLALALHSMAFVLTFVCLLCMPLAQFLVPALLPDHLAKYDVLETVSSSGTMPVIALYWAGSFRRVFGDSLGAAITRAVIATLGFLSAVLGYRLALFFVTYAST